MRNSESKKWKLKPQSVSLRETNVALSVHETMNKQTHRHKTEEILVLKASLIRRGERALRKKIRGVWQ